MTARHEPGSACDAALDYLYEMLDGEAKVAFETHLAGCARCQAELGAFGRVRSVAKTVLPPVEPSERLSGALHAQLMHAATQRTTENKGGKVLLFVRRLVTHPGYAAAAGLLFVGGVVGWQLSRGTLVMPAKQAESAATAPAPVAPEPAPAPVAAAKEEADETSASASPATPIAGEPGGAARALGKAKISVSPAEKQAEGEKGGATTGEPAKVLVTKTELTEDVAKAPAYKGAPAKKAASPSLDLDGLVDGGLRGASGQAYGGGSSLSRSGPSANAQAQAVDDGVGTRAHGYARAGKLDANQGDSADGSPKREQAAKPTAPPPPASVAPAPAPTASNDVSRNVERKPAARADAKDDRSEARNRDRGGAEESLREAEPASPAPKSESMSPAPMQQAEASRDKATFDEKRDSVDEDRNRATSLAQAGRCDEATVVFQGLEKRAPSRLTPQDRLTYTRCLRALGRLDPAQSELNQLRANRRSLPAVTLDAEQQAIDFDRQRSNLASKRAKAKRAVGASESIDAAPAKPADANTSKH